MGKSVTDIPFDPDRIDDDSQSGALPGIYSWPSSGP